MQHMDKNISPPTKPPRVSVPVTPEVLEVFQKLAKASNQSTGGAIAQWLADTVEGAEYMANLVTKARETPKIVSQELHAYALGLADETGALIKRIAKKGETDRAAARAGAGAGAQRTDGTGTGGPSDPSPRLVIRGGNSPQNTHKKGKGPK
jgi:hypothetical protein